MRLARNRPQRLGPEARRAAHPPCPPDRLTATLLAVDVEHATVEGVDVKVFGAVRTVVDLFRHERLVGLTIAIEGLKELLRTRRSTPGAIAAKAQALGAWTKMKPYLETLASDA